MWNVGKIEYEEVVLQGQIKAHVTLAILTPNIMI